MQRTAHEIQYKLYFFINNFHAFKHADPLLVTIYTIVSVPSFLIIPFNSSKMHFLSLILSNASTKLRKIVLPFEFTMKFIMLNLFCPVHPSHIIVHHIFSISPFHIFVLYTKVLAFNFIWAWWFHAHTNMNN